MASLYMPSRLQQQPQGTVGSFSGGDPTSMRSNNAASVLPWNIQIQQMLRCHQPVNSPLDHESVTEDEDEAEEDLNESKEQDDNDSERSGEDSESDSSVFDERQFIRVSTAPARPLTDIEQFKRSQEFLFLEQAVICSQNLIQKQYQKYDLDSTEGQKTCKRYLSIIARLCHTYSILTSSREYRSKFSKAYRILYKDDELCYLTEILDSAQEGFPYLWVNGEKFVFSSEVLAAGQELLHAFLKMQLVMRNAYSRACTENFHTCSATVIKQEVSTTLERFDEAWTAFECLYVFELMMIEQKARRFIQKAIDIEKEMHSLEIREKMKGRIFLVNSEITNLRKKLCKVICQINSVANVDGKGRDDLEFEILQASEGILRRISKEQSQAVRCLANSIRGSFLRLRELFRKYEQNIEMVDPQLKNNPDLVEALQEYETSWEKGREYFLDAKKCTYLVHFSHIIEATAQKHREFHEQVECREADIFLHIPGLLILKSLNDEDKNICRFFFPLLHEPRENKHCQMYNNLREEFALWKHSHNLHYEFHNILEKQLLNVPLADHDMHAIGEFREDHGKSVDKILHKIKQLAMEMQRHNPQEWNSFLNAALCEPSQDNIDTAR